MNSILFLLTPLFVKFYYEGATTSPIFQEDKIYYCSKNLDIYCPEYSYKDKNVQELIPITNIDNYSEKLNKYFPKDNPKKIKILNNIAKIDKLDVLYKIKNSMDKMIFVLSDIIINKIEKNDIPNLTRQELLKNSTNIDILYDKIIEILTLKHFSSEKPNLKNLKKTLINAYTNILILLSIQKLDSIETKNTNVQSIILDIFGLTKFKNYMYDGTYYANRALDWIILSKEETMNSDFFSRSYPQLLHSLIFNFENLIYFFFVYNKEYNIILALLDNPKISNTIYYLCLLYLFNIEVVEDSYFKEIAFNLIENKKEIISHSFE